MVVHEPDQLHKADYIHNIQFSARDLPVPRFSKPVEIRGGNPRAVKSIAFSCDGKRVATGCDQKGLRVWEVRDKMDSSTCLALPSTGDKASPHIGHVASLAWSPVDPFLLVSGCKSANGGAYVAVWDIRSPKFYIFTHKLPSDIINIAFHPSGTHFAVTTPRPMRDEVCFFHRVPADEAGALSSSSSHRAVGGEKEKWEKRADVGIGGSGGVDMNAEEINALRFSNSGKFLAAVSNDGSLTAWSYPLHPRVQPASASPISSPSVAVRRVIKADEEMAAPASPGVGGATSRVGSREASPVAGEDDGGGGEKEGGREEDEDGAVAGGGEADPAAEGETDEDGVIENQPVTDANDDVDMEKPSAGVGSESRPSVPAPSAPDVNMDEEATVPPPTPSRPATQPATAIATSSQPSSSRSSRAAATMATEPASIPSGPSTSTSTVSKAQAEAAAAKAKQLHRIKHAIIHTASLLALAFDPTGKYLALGGQDALLSLITTRDWICTRTYDIAVGAIRHIAFSPDGEYIAFGGDDTAIFIVSVHSGQTLARIAVAHTVNALTWHPSRNWLAYSVVSKGAIGWYMLQEE